MIRLLFFNHNFHFQQDHYGFYVAFWCRLVIESVLAIVLVIWMRRNEMMKRISNNRISTQYYFAVLMAPERQNIAKIVFDNLEKECHRFTECWKYQLWGIDTQILLTQWIGHDIASIICSYLFQQNQDWFNKDGILDIDETIWTSIKDIAFPDTDN